MHAQVKERINSLSQLNASEPVRLMRLRAGSSRKQENCIDCMNEWHAEGGDGCGRVVVIVTLGFAQADTRCIEM